MSDDFYHKVSKVYDWLKQKAKEKVRKLVSRLKDYYSELVYRTRIIRIRLNEKWTERWQPILNYGVFSLTPYVLAYGVLLNLVTSHFLNFSLTLTSVVAHGLLWYFVKEELTEILEELKPTVKADVKVKGR